MDKKVQPRYFDGFKFLRLSDLPANQASMFQGWVSGTAGLSLPSEIKAEKEDIVQYDDYDFWFDYHYLTEKDLDELI